MSVLQNCQQSITFLLVQNIQSKHTFLKNTCIPLHSLNKMKDIDKFIFDKNDSLITQTLLFGDEKLSITFPIQFLISSGRFDTLSF